MSSPSSFIQHKMNEYDNIDEKPNIFSDKITKQYPPPTEFSQKLMELAQKLPHVYESFEKSFVLHHKNPNDNEYKQIYEGDKRNLEGIINDGFLLENDVTNNIRHLNVNLEKIYAEIEILKKENKRLKRKAMLFNNSANTSDEMFDNYKEFYEIQYLRNWAVVLAIIIVIVTISKVFKSKQFKV
uniref:Uncharacterized protein n=1 Tax=viral metagenome TaxID=1070528 RepID=A0A6C0LP08_9ZZZZ